MTKARNLTAVLIVYRKNRINHRLRFGTPVAMVRRGWHRALAVFEPGQIFGYIRWRGDKYGTQDWRLYVVQARTTGPIVDIDGIIPGADIFLETRGSTRTKRALALLDRLEAGGQSLESVTPAYWRHAHNALITGREPHVFSKLQRRSFAGAMPC